ncbi:uncharacterized protein LOC123524370 [Mercenaria mercenaria]|uniref:uncharacterized protein LOC123524370 n=1 Tax=Mercenaria mercenaria TaxID=6596 RepID=UPI00234EA2D7|nr:uncharacterized protein LOC123524370 [Mercenaria mercenaria]
MVLKRFVSFFGLHVVTIALNVVAEKPARYDNEGATMSDPNVGTPFEHFLTNKKLDDVLARMERLEAREKARAKTYLNEIQNLRRQLLIQMRRTTSLERIVRRLSSERSDLLNQSLDKQWQFPMGIEGQVKPPNVQYRDDQNKRIRRTRNESPVAFFAALKQHLSKLGAHQPITFENVVTNIGNAYNNTSGSFIAPVPDTLSEVRQYPY